MQNFTFANPTKIIFGKAVIARLAPEAAKAGKKALLVYGGGSIKKNGVYDVLTLALAKEGIAVTEHHGVKPNPVLSHVRAGIKKAREQGCDLVVAAGGGGACFDGRDPAGHRLGDELRLRGHQRGDGAEVLGDGAGAFPEGLRARPGNHHDAAARPGGQRRGGRDSPSDRRLLYNQGRRQWRDRRGSARPGPLRNSLYGEDPEGPGRL